jgi:glc operon protein GlcG
MRAVIGLLLAALAASAADLTVKKSLNLAVIKEMVAAAEAEMEKRKVSVTIVIVDESGNLLFLQKGDRAGLNTINFAQRKARHSALFGTPSARSAQLLREGNTAQLVMPNAFPNQGGLPIKADGVTIGAIACSGAPSEVDEAIAQAAIDAAIKK